MDRKIVEMLIAGHSLREITQALRVGDRRVRRLRILAEDYGYLDRENPRPLPAYPEAPFADQQQQQLTSDPAIPGDNAIAIVRPVPPAAASEADALLASRREWIIDRLQAGWHPITVFEEIGLPVGRSSFYRYLQRHDLHKIGERARSEPRVVPEIVHRPGEALLLDWGKLRDVACPETGKIRPLWAFVGVLGFSRYLVVRLVWTNDLATTIAALQSMLAEIGGVPSRITSDNPKCFATEASRYEPLLNPVFERMAAHYGVTIECLPPASPEKKGKVERPMPYVRRLYEAHGSAWHGLDESQAYLDRKLEVANLRKHGTTRMRPAEQFKTLETPALRPLPALAYEPETFSDGVVRQDGHVRFENRYYSVAAPHVGAKVVILGSLSHVSIYRDGKLIEVHEKLSDPHRSKSTKPEHLKPWERAMLDDSIYLKRARAIGPDCERFVSKVLARGQGFIDTRKIWGVLSLDKSHASVRVNAACRNALELDSLSYRMVKSLLMLTEHPAVVAPASPSVHAPEPELAPASTTPPPAASPSHKFVRPMSVYEEQLELLVDRKKQKSELFH